MNQRRKQLAKRRLEWLKPTLTAALLLTLMLYLLPLALVLSSSQGAAAREPLPLKQDNSPYPVAQPTQDASSASVSDETQDDSEPVMLRCLLNGEVRDMELEDYLWGVVAAEMPAGFDQQALCAQAVAARTYTRYRMEHPIEKHPEADICGDPACCQAWKSREESLKDWAKSERKQYEKKITRAIEETAGLTLYYDDSPIMAAFHAASAGSTKSALEVWGEDYPYLQEVSSPETEESVPNYYSKVSVLEEDFDKLFREAYPNAELNGTCDNWFGEVKYDDAGLPIAMEVGGIMVETNQLRGMLGLRSASFSVDFDEDHVIFYVTGYGHGVGMSQYGANALAKEGKTFREILAWYYPKTELK